MVKLNNNEIQARAAGVAPIGGAFVGQAVEYAGNSMASLFGAGPETAPKVATPDHNSIGSLITAPRGPGLDMA